MTTKMENTVYVIVKSVCEKFYAEVDRQEVGRLAAMKLNNEYNINCARDDTKAGDYLAEALDYYLY